MGVTRNRNFDDPSLSTLNRWEPDCSTPLIWQLVPERRTGQISGMRCVAAHCRAGGGRYIAGVVACARGAGPHRPVVLGQTGWRGALSSAGQKRGSALGCGVVVDAPRRCAAASTRVPVDETTRAARTIRSAIAPLGWPHIGAQSHRPADGRGDGIPRGIPTCEYRRCRLAAHESTRCDRDPDVGRGGPGSGDASGATGPRREPSNVTIIDMRRPVAAAQDELDGASGRQYPRHWWVGGHGANRRADRAEHNASRYGCRPMSRAPRVHRWSQKKGLTF
jgi:hypothetical protein